VEEGSGEGVRSSHCTRILTRTRVARDQTSYWQSIRFLLKNGTKYLLIQEAKLPVVDHLPVLLDGHILMVPCLCIANYFWWMKGGSEAASDGAPAQASVVIRTRVLFCLL